MSFTNTHYISQTLLVPLSKARKQKTVTGLQLKSQVNATSHIEIHNTVLMKSAHILIPNISDY